MSDKLIQELADKLGTTTEYIFGVMVQQAPVYAAITVVEMLAVSLYGWVLWKIHCKFSKKQEGSSWTYYENDEGIILVPLIIAALIWFVLFLCCLFAIHPAITAIINPEYWALKRIVNICN